MGLILDLQNAVRSFSRHKTAFDGTVSLFREGQRTFGRRIHGPSSHGSLAHRPEKVPSQKGLFPFFESNLDLTLNLNCKTSLNLVVKAQVDHDESSFFYRTDGFPNFYQSSIQWRKLFGCCRPRFDIFHRACRWHSDSTVEHLSNHADSQFQQPVNRRANEHLPNLTEFRWRDCNTLRYAQFHFLAEPCFAASEYNQGKLQRSFLVSLRLDMNQPVLNDTSNYKMSVAQVSVVVDFQISTLLMARLSA